MGKAKGEAMETKRFWVRATEETRRNLRHLALDLDVTAEVLCGYILADAVAKAQGNAESLRRVLPKPKVE